MSIASKISGYNRKRKWLIFTKNILYDQHTKILDVGFNNVEYSSVDNYLEKNYPFQQNITALGITGKNIFEKLYPLLKAILYDGKTFPFRDNNFDICWSNAVIEHVGDIDAQLFFIREMKRVSKIVFFTTPNKHFPIEIHTRTPLLHFLPKHIFEKYLNLIGKKWATGDYMNLLTKKDLTKLLEAAKITNYKIIENKILGFTLDYIIIFKSEV